MVPNMEMTVDDGVRTTDNHIQTAHVLISFSSPTECDGQS